MRPDPTRAVAAAVAAALVLTIAATGCERPTNADALWTDVTSAIVATDASAHGRVDVRLSLPDARATDRVAFSWVSALDGAKVDVVAETAHGDVPLVAGRRVGGATLTVPLDVSGCTGLRVSVHHHVRRVPILRRVELGRAPA